MIRLERRVSTDGMVSVGGNYYSVPDRARRRVLEVHSLAHQVQIYEDGQLLAIHPILEGRRQSSILAGHRQAGQHALAKRSSKQLALGVAIGRRPLEFYEQVARRLGRARELA